MTRRKMREHAFCLLFLKDFHDEDELPEQISLYLDMVEEIKEEEIWRLNKTLGRIMEHMDQIDQKIKDSSEHWKLERMGKVDLTIIRLAVYEIFYDEEIPDKVAINEAVDLSKKFGEEHSQSFVNGVLGKIVS